MYVSAGRLHSSFKLIIQHFQIHRKKMHQCPKKSGKLIRCHQTVSGWKGIRLPVSKSQLFPHCSAVSQESWNTKPVYFRSLFTTGQLHKYLRKIINPFPPNIIIGLNLIATTLKPIVLWVSFRQIILNNKGNI